LQYIASPGDDNLALVHFGSGLDLGYPLSYYQSFLRLSELPLSVPNASSYIKPKPVRRAWDRVPLKKFWISTITGVYVCFWGIAILLMRLPDPIRIARGFFTEAGLKIRTSHNQFLQLISDPERSDSFAILWDARWNARVHAVGQHRSGDPRRFKLYIIYSRQPPSSNDWKSLRDSMN